VEEEMAAENQSPNLVSESPESRSCCWSKILSLQLDFVNEWPLLQETIEESGHICLFIPKFHCELNPIELFWSYIKQCKYILFSRFVFPFVNLDIFQPVGNGFTNTEASRITRSCLMCFGSLVLQGQSEDTFVALIDKSRLISKDIMDHSPWSSWRNINHTTVFLARQPWVLIFSRCSSHNNLLTYYLCSPFLHLDWLQCLPSSLVFLLCYSHIFST
jgi:hypothetical protein